MHLNCVTLIQFLFQLHFRNLKKQCAQTAWNVRRSSQHANALLARLGKIASTPQVLKNSNLTLYVEAEVSLWEIKSDDQTFIRCVKWPETFSVLNMQAIGTPFAKSSLQYFSSWLGETDVVGCCVFHINLNLMWFAICQALSSIFDALSGY